MISARSAFRSLFPRTGAAPRRRTLLELRDVSVRRYDGSWHVDLSVTQGEVLAVVGDPGSSQRCLLQLLAGTLEPDSGEVERHGGVVPACSWLDPDLPDLDRVGEFLSHPRSAATGEPRASEQLDPGVDSELVSSVLRGIGGPGTHRHLHTLDEAERHQVSLAAALLCDAELVLLENPTRHLDISAIGWLGDHIAASDHAWVLATHDRVLIDQVAGRVAVLRRGALSVHDGNFTELLRSVAGDTTGFPPLSKDNSTRELSWLHEQRPVDSADRIANYQARQLAAQGASREFGQIQIPPGPTLQEPTVATATGLTRVRSHRPVVNELTVSVARGAIVAVIGPRGCGKTTLLELFAGREQADGGTLVTGASVRRAYVGNGDLDRFADSSVWAVLAEGKGVIDVGGEEVASRALLEAFGFRGRRQLATGADLTSAERDRLRLALSVVQGGNVLILDDPTGGMEIDMLTALENALLEFPGTVFLSTHDRWLLRRVATHVIAADPGPTVGGWVSHEGGYDSFLARAADDAEPGPVEDEGDGVPT